MKRSYKTFTYPSEYDEKECEEFIKHFQNLAYHISLDILKSKNYYFGLDLMRTAALEGCFKAYIASKKLNAQEYVHKKGLVRMCVKRAFFSFAKTFGFLPSSGQQYFPKSYVKFDDYFRDRSQDTFKDMYNKIDSEIINSLIATFPDKQAEIHQLYMSGYDFSEIAERVGYKDKSSPLKMHERTLERVKEWMNPPKECEICHKKFRVGEGCGEFCSKVCSRKNALINHEMRAV